METFHTLASQVRRGDQLITPTGPAEVQRRSPGAPVNGHPAIRFTLATGETVDIPSDVTVEIVY